MSASSCTCTALTAAPRLAVVPADAPTMTLAPHDMVLTAVARATAVCPHPAQSCALVVAACVLHRPHDLGCGHAGDPIVATRAVSCVWCARLCVVSLSLSLSLSLAISISISHTHPRWGEGGAHTGVGCVCARACV